VVSASKPSEGFGGFGLKNIGGRFAGLDLKTRRGRLVVWALKSSAAGVDRFGPQNRGVADRRTRGSISKLLSRRSDVEKALGPLNRYRKTWTDLPLVGIWDKYFM
jgi:hypothetical protein